MSSTDQILLEPWHFSQEPDSLTLDIAVIGAGIAGLAAAAALSRVGHNVEIYERSQFKNEVGAAIGVAPNVTGVLRGLGFDYDRARAVTNHRTVIWDGITMTPKFEADWKNISEDYGSPWFMIHRQDLHTELKNVALSPPNGIKAAKLNLASAVVSVDCEAATLTLADGRTIKKHVIIGADGSNSLVSKTILGADMPPFAISDQSCFRWLVPTRVLEENELTKPLLSPHRMNACVSPDRRFILYPCRDGELYNFAGLHPTKVEALEDGNWAGPGEITDLLETFKGFHPSLLEAARLAEDLKLWKLKFRPPVERWTKGRAIAIGDAAHPMLPHHAQAGNMAIEDAGALALLLSNLQCVDEIPRRLEMVQNVRKSRTSAIQIFSNSPQDSPGDVEKAVRPYFEGPIPQNSIEFAHYIFGYDLLGIVRKATQDA